MLNFNEIKNLKDKITLPETELLHISKLYLYALKVKKEKPETIIRISLKPPITNDIIDCIKQLDKLDNIRIKYKTNDDFTINEFISFNNKLNEMIEPVITHDFTPFEAYLYLYNVVKSYKLYDNECEYNKSTQLKYILNNNHINCVGFVRLLVELLNRLNIEAVRVRRITENNEEAFKYIRLEGHARALIHINDQEYNINGYYIADPTWDNNIKKNGTLMKNLYIYYNLICHDEEEIERDMFKLSREDYIFNNHNMEEFNKKFNIYLDKANKNNQSEIIALREMYLYSIKLLKNLDYEIFKTLIDKFFIEESNQDKQIYYDYFTELENMILKKVNKKIDNETIKKALLNIEIKLGIYNEEELEKYMEKLDKTFIKKDYYFPYIKDLNNPNKRIEKDIKKR